MIDSEFYKSFCLLMSVCVNQAVQEVTNPDIRHPSIYPWPKKLTYDPSTSAIYIPLGRKLLVTVSSLGEYLMSINWTIEFHASFKTVTVINPQLDNDVWYWSKVSVCVL